jgi:hypothetical protein
VLGELVRKLSLFAQHLQSRRGKYIEQLSNYSACYLGCRKSAQMLPPTGSAGHKHIIRRSSVPPVAPPSPCLSGFVSGRASASGPTLCVQYVLRRVGLQLNISVRIRQRNTLERRGRYVRDMLIPGGAALLTRNLHVKGRYPLRIPPLQYGKIELYSYLFLRQTISPITEHKGRRK